MEQNKISLFVSHSSKDERIVKMLVNLIRNAFPIPANEIRCTSLAGYGLNIGADTIKELRKEAIQAKVFVAVFTPNALSSAFTMLEIGCRWGRGKKNSFLPIVCDNQGIDILQGPIRHINAAIANDTASIHSFICSLERALEIKKNEPDVYNEDVNKLAKVIRLTRPKSKEEGKKYPNAKLEEYAVKAITAEFNLWLNSEDHKKDEESYQKRKEIVDSEYDPVFVFQEIRDMYIALEYERIDKRFEVEKRIRKQYGIGIDDKRIKVVKDEAFEIAKEYYSTAIDLARLNTERHMAKYLDGNAYKYKYDELDEKAANIKNQELTSEKDYIETKALELEAACNFPK